MKKIKLIAPILACGAVAAAIVPMVSCGAKKIGFTYNEGHYESGTLSFNAKKKYEFVFTTEAKMTNGFSFGLYVDMGSLPFAIPFEVSEITLKIDGQGIKEGLSVVDKSIKYSNEVDTNKKVSLTIVFKANYTADARVMPL